MSLGVKSSVEASSGTEGRTLLFAFWKSASSVVSFSGVSSRVKSSLEVKFFSADKSISSAEAATATSDERSGLDKARRLSLVPSSVVEMSMLLLNKVFDEELMLTQSSRKRMVNVSSEARLSREIEKFRIFFPRKLDSFESAGADGDFKAQESSSEPELDAYDISCATSSSLTTLSSSVLKKTSLSAAARSSLTSSSAI